MPRAPGCRGPYPTEASSGQVPGWKRGYLRPGGPREACLVRPPSVRMRGRLSQVQSLAEPPSRAAAEAGRAWDSEPASQTPHEYLTAVNI